MFTTQSKDGTTIAYDKLGDGPALINITGASCFRNFMPIKQDVKVFSKEFTVYNYDRRGRGDSGDTQPYDIQREIEDIEALIDAAGGKANLYGHSSGAVLALEAAMRLPNKVSKVAVYDAAYAADEAEKKSFVELRPQIKTLLDAGNNKAALRTFFNCIGMPKLFVWLMPVFPGWSTMVRLAPTLMYDIALTQDFAPLLRARSIHVDTLVMVGEKSPPGMPLVAKQLVQSIPQSKIDIVAGQDHMVSAKVLLPKFVEFFKASA
jgi:pimeloyl-ACP methyl ester carboxylesterase